jgi:putative oxidoreductase
MFGVWGGPGLSAMMGPPGPPPNPGMGPVLGLLVSVGEFFGGMGLIVGILTRFSAASLIVIMIGAIAMVHGKNGFFLHKGGFEYNLALIGLLLPIVLCGPGRYSIGRYILPKSQRTGRPVIVLE